MLCHRHAVVVSLVTKFHEQCFSFVFFPFFSGNPEIPTNPVVLIYFLFPFHFLFNPPAGRNYNGRSGITTC